MLHLNLLPPHEKQNLHFAMRTRAILAVSGGLGAATAVFVVLLIPTFLRVALQTSDVLRAVRIETETQERIGIAKEVERVRYANRLADAALGGSDRGASVSELVGGVFAAVPSVMTLSRAYYRASTHDLTIEGFSSSRAFLLSFTRALEGMPSVASVSSPVGNLIREADIHFTLTVKFH